MSLDPGLRSRIDDLLREHPVVLFMKGTRDAPRCGFSAATVEALNEVLPEYVSVDVLADPDLREGIKVYANWPTIPQLFVNGELVGGADIVRSMYTSGELHSLFGVPAPDRTPPEITISDAAATAIREALTETEPGLGLHLSVDAQFRAQFQLAPADERAVIAEANGIRVYMDAATAPRARGLRIDWVETPQGAGLSIDNPNAPAPVKSISPAELKRRLDTGEAIAIVDVRPPEERAQAALNMEVRNLDGGVAAFAALPKDTALAFLCHGGTRSERAAEHFRALGFRNVYNIAGGIDAWSRDVDANVPRY